MGTGEAVHKRALDWLGQQVSAYVARHGWPADVLEIGSRDINGTPRVLFPPSVFYVGIDLAPGKGVDIVADAVYWQPDAEYDLVICAEVLEHAPEWPGIIDTAYKALKPGGYFLMTCATGYRHEHSGITGAQKLEPGEYYRNVGADEALKAMRDAGFTQAQAWYDSGREDLRTRGLKP